MKKKILLFALLLFAVSSAWAQSPNPVTTIQPLTAVTCTNYEAQVTVQDFTNVGAVSLVLNYNPAVFAYIGEDINSGIAAIPNGAVPGQFILSYFGDEKTLGPGDVLFTLQLKLLPAVIGSSTSLAWSTIPGECEYSGPGGTPVYVSTFNNYSYTIPVKPVVNEDTDYGFCTIQEAIDHPLTDNGDVITVAAGNYPEDIIVTKSLDIRGPNFGITPNGGSRVSEAYIFPATSSKFGEIIKVRASNVHIDGFTIDGDNPNLTSNLLGTNGADIDAAEAVTVYVDNISDMKVSNNIIKNLTYYGVTLYGATFSAPATTGHEVTDNKFMDLGIYTDPDPTGNNMNYWGGGVLLYNNQYTKISGNHMLNVRVGIQTGNFSQADPGSEVNRVMSDNEIQARRRGIFHNLQYGSTSSYTLSGNTITALANVNETNFWDGIFLCSLSVPSTCTDNTINGSGLSIPTQGYQVWNVKSTFPAVISGGSVSNVNNGVFANNWEGYGPGDGTDGAHATVSGLAISPNTGGTGVRLHDHPSSTHGNVQVTIGSGVSITGGAKGLVVDGANAKVVSPMGNLAFSGQTGRYIELTDNANFIDATAATFAGITGSAMTLTELFTTEDMIDHKIDNPALGFVLVKANNDYVTLNSFIAPATTPSIQRGIDAASNGFTVNVQAGNYGIQTADNRSVFGTNGPHVFGLFIDKDNLTLRGYNASDLPVATASEAAVLFQTGSTANFGPSGVFVQGSGVTLEGLKIGDNIVGGNINSNKTIEIVGDAFTMNKCFVNTSEDQGAVYMGMWDETHPIVSYSFTGNNFNHTLISINNGAGMSGPRSGRIITDNLFTGVATPYLIGFRGWNGASPAQGWILYPCGGAIVTGNQFNNTGMDNYVIARGNAGGYANAELNWSEIWTANTFGNHVVTLSDELTFAVRSYNDGTYPETRRISNIIQPNVTIGQANDVVLVSAGTFDEQLVADGQSLTIKGQGDATIIKPASASILTSFYTYPAGTFWPGTIIAPVILVKNSGNVVLKDFKVDGANITSLPAGAARLSGILYGESAGVIDDITVNTIKTTDYVDRSYGIDLSAVGTARIIEVKGCSISDWARTGIQAMGASLTANIHNNTLVGPGTIGPANVPNGIVFIHGVGGSAINNTISNCHYTTTDWGSVGIMVYNPVTDGILIEQNEVFNCDAGVALSTNANDVVVQLNNLHNNGNGLQIESGALDNSILKNTIVGNVEGIYLDSDIGTGNFALNNDLSGNTTAGLENASALNFTAPCNWFGSADYNLVWPEVIGNVTFVPYLVTNNLTTPDCNGQVPPVKNVTKNYFFNTIQPAIDDAITTDNDVIRVAAGNFPGNIDIDKDITLEGANAGTACYQGRLTESTIAGNGGAAVTVSSNGVTIDGFEITNPTGNYAITATGRNNLLLENNVIHNIGTSGTGPVHAVAIVMGAEITDNVQILKNCIYDVNNVANNGSGSGVAVGWSNATTDISNLKINNNKIYNVNSNPATTGGKGAYGIIVNVGSSSTGKAIAPQIMNNSISDLDGLWAHGIGLEGNTPGAVVTNNDIFGLTSYKSPQDAAGVMVEGNTGAASSAINNNSFTNMAVGILNVTAVTADGTCNWYGPTLSAKTYGPVTSIPWLTSGANTVLSPLPGFGPGVACVSCALVLTETHVDVNCPLEATGSIDLTVTGGVAPLSFAWTGPNGYSSIIEDPLELFAGQYNVTVTAANGCTASTSVTLILIDHPAPSVPTGGFSTVECAASATAPNPPAVTDYCGTAITPTGPVTGGNYDGCEGTKTYTWTYTDYQPKSSTWTYTYTIEHITPPVVPANVSKTVSCPADAVPPTSSPTLDQQQLQYYSLGNWTDFTSIGQSFTCGVSGKLTQIDVDVVTLVTPQTFTLSIYSGVGIDGALLYSGIQTISATGWKSLSIPTAAAPYLTAGNQYTFWISSFIYNQLGLRCMNPNAYNGGVSMDGCTLGCAPPYDWQQFPAYDLVFKTYMTVIPIVTDVCGVVIPTPAPVITNAPDPLTCEGTRTYTYTYTDCASLSTNWVYTVNVDYSGGLTPPASTTATVSCPSLAVNPGPPANITDACGRSVSPVLIGRTPATGPECNGTVVWRYRYTACDLTTTADWTKSYTVTYSGGLANVPANTTGLVSCPADATDPGAPASVLDACGRTVNAVFVAKEQTPDPVTCNGTIVYRYRYAACDGTTIKDWTKTYTVTYSGGLANVPQNEAAIVSCPAAATDPGAPASILDACGRTVNAVLVGSVDNPNPVTCEGTRVWTYRYTACDNTTTADWTFTYTIDHTTAPVVPASPAPTTVECEAAATPPAPPSGIVDVCGTIINPTGPVVGGTYSSLYVENFSKAVVIDQTSGPGIWYTDRYAPYAFVSPVSFDGDYRLKHSINAADYQGFPSFYSTQGRAYDLMANTGYVEIKLYIPADWATSNKRMAGLWGVAVDNANLVSGYPIVEFCSDGNNPRFRAWESGTGGWIDMGLPTGFPYNCWVTLSIKLLPSGEFLLTAVTPSGTLNYTTNTSAPDASQRLKSIILQGHNYNPADPLTGVTYDIYWDDFAYQICEGTKTYTYTYKDCSGLSTNWVYTYTIDKTTPPAQFEGPVAITSTVSCASAATVPTNLPVVKDVCGVVIPAPVPVVSPDPACEGTKTYQYTYTDCSGLNYVWTYTYVIDYSGGLSAPASTVSTVSCPAYATDPGAPASILDACGRTVNAVLVNSVDNPNPVTCEGTRVWTYSYTACDNTTKVYWTHTYTINYSGGLTPPSNGSLTVSGPAQAVNPGAPANITDACGRSVSAVLIGSVDNPSPLLCEGTRVWTYRYTDCDGSTTADWTFTYNVVKSTISGTLKYNNNAKTPMNNVVLTLNPGGATSTTSVGGSYSFPDLCPGNYTISVTTIGKPIGGINSTDAAMVNAWSTTQPGIEHVKFNAGEVNYNYPQYTITAPDALAIQSYFVFNTQFPRKLATNTPWTFWTAGDLITLGNGDPARIPQAFNISCSGNLTVDLYGMAIGDFNGSFTPGGAKAASSTVDLVYNETRQAGDSTDLELPVYIVNPSVVGAVSLILNFPPELVEITGVTMEENGGQLDWSVNGNELRIGWNSIQPLWFKANDELLTISLKTSATFSQGNAIRFELAADPLNEMADGNLDVIPDATIGIDIIEFSTYGIFDPATGSGLTLESRPNPFASYTTLSYNLPAEGHVTLIVNDMLGRQVSILEDEFQVSGNYSVKLDALPLQPGVYSATLTLHSSSGDMIRTIKLVRNR